ncbi:MAG TPA: hypothetical protein VMU50_13965 [Polyangia bacterium]|nr:hypothetical protein [Polyangia bacterium]
MASGRLAGPWMAAAGRATPADTVLMAYATAASNGVDLELRVVAAPADGSTAPATAAAPVAVIAGGAKSDPLPLVALGSSRSGMRAALAWTVKGAGQLTAVVLDADGHPVGNPIAVDSSARVACVAFVAGKSDLSLAYYRYGDAADPPQWVIAETSEANYVQETLAIDLDDASPSCPLVLATSGGYTLAWQTSAGSSLGIYDAGLFRDHRFADAFQFGGSNLQPPLAGLGAAGLDFAVVLARAGAAEVWRVSADGPRLGAPLVFPSAEGNLGDISSVPVGGALYSTYADYERAGAGVSGKLSASSVDAGSEDAAADAVSDSGGTGGGGPNQGGQRYLLETTCL